MRFEAITSKYVDPPFNCGVSSIQDLMANAYCSTLMRQGSAFNVVLGDEVVAQFMLTMAFVYDEDYECSPKGHTFACVKIEYLAVEQSLQNRGIGTAVLKRVIEYIKMRINNLPVRFILIESVQDRVDWYAKYGFCKLAETVKIYHADEFTVPMCIDFIDAKALDAFFAV